MWKRFLVMIIALVGTFSVVYAINNDLSAASVNVLSGGTVSGRVSKKPSNLIGEAKDNPIGFSKDDVLQMNTKNTYTNRPVAWILTEKESYVDYTSASCTPTVSAKCNNPMITAWYAMSYDPVDRINPGGTINDYVDVVYSAMGEGKSYAQSMPYGLTNMRKRMKTFNESLRADAYDWTIIAPRNFTKLHRSYDSWKGTDQNGVAYDWVDLRGTLVQSVFSTQNGAAEEMKNYAFTPSTVGVDTTRKFSSPYLTSWNYNYNVPRDPINNPLGDRYRQYYVEIDGTISASTPSNLPYRDNSQLTTSGISHDLRAGVYLAQDKLDQIVFAVSNGSTTGLATISNGSRFPLRSRIYDASMKATIEKITTDVQGTDLLNDEVKKNASVYIKGDANNVNGSVVSAVIFDANGNFKYYLPLETAKNSGYYAFNTTGIPVGTYQVAIVNEILSTVDTLNNTKSSALSDVKTIRIVNDISEIKYTLTYQGTPTIANTHEYGINVNNGNQVASLSVLGDADITSTSLVSDTSVTGHANDYTLFSINKTDATKPTIVVNQTTGLDVGDYYFKIKANVKAGGNVTTGTVKLTVKPAKAELEFANTSDVNIAIGDSISTGLVTSTNTDAAAAIKFSLSSHSSNALSLVTSTNPKEYKVQVAATYTGSELPQVVTLSASMGATDNYQAASTITKKYTVYKKLNSLAFTYAKDHEDHGFITNETTSGSVLGTLSVKDGVPAYTYSMAPKTASNHNDKVSITYNDVSKTYNVITSEQLKAGTYTFEFKVTDSVGGQATTSASINVTTMDQTKLVFKDKATGGTELKTLTIPYTKTSNSKQLFTEGGNVTSNAIYKLKDGQASGVVSISESGLLTWNKVGGPIIIAATKSGNDVYNSVSAELPVTITPGLQNIEFAANGVPKFKNVGDAAFSMPATLNRSDGSSATITYTASPESVCTIDGTGRIAIKGSGTCSINAKNTDANYQPVSTDVSFPVYASITATFAQNSANNPLAVGKPINTSVGVIENVQGGAGGYSYAFKNADTLFNIDGSGRVTLNRTLNRTDINTKWDATASAYVIKETIVITDRENNKEQIEATVICEGEESDAAIADVVNGKLHKKYNVNVKTFDLIANETHGANVTFLLEDNAKGLLESLSPQGTAIIKKAGENAEDHAKVKATISANDGYKEKIISFEIYIDKATQSVAFDAGTITSHKFEENGTFTVKATATQAGSTITYESTTPAVCTVSGNTVKMITASDCKLIAKASLTNYEDAESPEHKITLYKGANVTFEQTTDDLQALPDTAAIPDDAVAVGKITTTGGLNAITYAFSNNVSEANGAKGLFEMSTTTGNVTNISLKKNVTASQVILAGGVYDSTSDAYLLKFQVDVFDGANKLDNPVDCVVKIKGAKLTLSFNNATAGTITEVYKPNGFFDLGIKGNIGNGDVTYVLTEVVGKEREIVTLSDNRVTIKNADDEMPVITATVSAKGGYEKQEISANIKINKANQDKFVLGSDQQNLKLSLDGIATLNPPANESGEILEITSNKPDVVEVLADGKTIQALKADTAVISIKSPGNRNYNEKTLTINVNVFGSLSGTITQTEDQILQADKTASINQTVGTFDIEGGLSPISNITTTLAENPNIKMTNNGSGNYTLRLKKTITATDLETCTYDAVNDVYLLPISIEVYDPLLPVDEQKVTITDNIKIEGADMDADIVFTDALNGKITKVYSLGGSLPFSLEERDYTDPTTITYRLKSGSATDVISQPGIEDGTYVSYIDAASQSSDPKVYVEAIIPSQKGYTGMIVETEIEITQAEQTFKFAQESMDLALTDKREHLITVGKGANGNPTLTMDPIGIVVIKGTSSKPTISSTGLGTTTITASDAGNRNYKPHTATMEVKVYEKAALKFSQATPYPQADSATSETGKPAGTYTTENGAGNVSVALADEADFAGNTYFQIINEGVLSFGKDITADILKNYPWNETEKAYEMQVQFKLSDDAGNITNATETVYVKGASLSNIAFKDKDGNATDTITKNYADKQFILELTGKVGNTWPYGEVAYSLETENSPNADGKSTIIESIDPVTGITKILNANLTAGPGSDEIASAKASIKAANGYDEQEVKAKIVINKADQLGFKFGSTNYPIELDKGGLNIVLSGKLSSGSVTYDIADESKVIYDADTDMFLPKALGSTIVTATTDINDRNYNVAQTQTTIQVINGAADVLTIKIDPGSTVTYGDTGVTASIKSTTVTGTVKSQKWSSTDTSVAEIDETTGAITIIGRGQTQITLTQEIEGRTENVKSIPITLNVRRKVLYVKIADAEKLVGEDMPTFAIESVVGLVGTDTFISPVFICLDGDDNLVNPYTGVGEYEIKGIFDETKNPNYTLMVDNGATSTVTNGKLTVKQDGSDSSWYKVRSEVSPTESGWYNKDVYLDLVERPDQVYDRISDKIDGVYDKSIPVQEEGIHDKDIYFKASSNNAITTPQEATVKVDQTNPQITTVTGKTINDNTFAKVMNTLTLNAFFKPGSEITINAQDIAPQTGITTSGLAKIDYEVHSEVADENGNTLIKQDSVIGEKATFTLDDLGDYNICAIATDNAGNQSPPTCQKATVSKIDVDVDGDGKPDFNDPNGDGCADLNIKWKDPNDPNKWIIINGDRDYDGIPDLNVDSDGDGKPNLNIDTDGDNLPDINLVILKKGDWTAGTCIIGDAEEYSGGTTSVKPQINIDTGDDQIPDINIDTNGDMKADYNITKPGETKPYLNIGKVHTVWTPNKSYTYKAFDYDSIGYHAPTLNIDTDGDGEPDVSIDLDGDNVADLNIDLNGDLIPDIYIDGDGDGEPDFNLDPDEDGKPTKNIIEITTWKPNINGNKKDDMIFDTMDLKMKSELEDNGVILDKPGGGFLPNYSLRVKDARNSISSAQKKQLDTILTGDTEINDIFDVLLYQGEVEIKPDGIVRVRLPLKDSYDKESLRLFTEQKDSTFKETVYNIEEKYIVYESDWLGKVCIISNKADASKDNEIPSTKSPTPKENIDETKTDGTYATGGAYTGDHSNIMTVSFVGCFALVITVLARKKKRS